MCICATDQGLRRAFVSFGTCRRRCRLASMTTPPRGRMPRALRRLA
ncbi:hypothetical protein [Lysobacter gummosus]